MTDVDMEDCYSSCINRICRVAEIIALKICIIVEETLGSNKVFLKKTTEIACKVSHEHKEITFDESSALLFSENALKFLKSCGLKGLLLDTLTTFLESISEFGNGLVDIPI